MINQSKYDFIIAGSGCAGLSLAIQLKQSKLSFNKILIIDKEVKNVNNRTWCFWTNQPINWYDEIVFKQWDKFIFKTDTLNKELFLKPYKYKLIKGLDFYTYCLNELQTDNRFEFVNDEIVQINSEDNQAFVKTSSNKFYGKYVFNSAIRTHNIK